MGKKSVGIREILADFGNFYSGTEQVLKLTRSTGSDEKNILGPNPAESDFLEKSAGLVGI